MDKRQNSGWHCLKSVVSLSYNQKDKIIMTTYIEITETSFNYTPQDKFQYDILSDFAQQLQVVYVINDDKTITFSSDNLDHLQECYDQLHIECTIYF